MHKEEKMTLFFLYFRYVSVIQCGCIALIIVVPNLEVISVICYSEE